ncbi:hypothetical protein [Bizionia sp. M204]|uniref:hypothetical protein n=1 Tax=Bizionia sp. M204 TaxID=2675331 RepID=UPI00204543C8|nr:hypothetical protein [Bizionia sp. M204]UPS92831.1 hypothetical protein GMA17_14350 [Bizionia sp. M204]
MMMNNYFGVLSDFKKEKFNRIASHCIEIGIYNEYDELEFIAPGVSKTYLPSNMLYGTIFFNENHYNIKKEITNEIYSVAKTYMSNIYNIQFSRFKNEQLLKLNTFTNKAEKEKFLQKAILKLNKKGLKDPFFIDFMGLGVENEKEGFIKWEDFVKIHIETDDYWISNYLFGISEFNIHVNEVVKTWMKFIKIKMKIGFYEKAMKTFQNSLNIDEKQSLKKLTPMQHVCYINKLRGIDFSLLNEANKIEHLNKITGNNITDLDKQLRALDSLVNLSQDEHDVLIEKTSKYANILNTISKASIDNLKKSVKDFQRSSIPIEIRKTVEAKKEQERFYKAQRKIKEAMKTVNSLF